KFTSYVRRLKPAVTKSVVPTALCKAVMTLKAIGVHFIDQSPYALLPLKNLDSKSSIGAADIVTMGFNPWIR
ncbi:MAG TPA: hypothetical protein VK957_07350, partial [Lunatimonas sp.]|nr:hypothetical protein [Lunatimonas sp.]